MRFWKYLLGVGIIGAMALFGSYEAVRAQSETDDVPSADEVIQEQTGNDELPETGTTGEADTTGQTGTEAAGTPSETDYTETQTGPPAHAQVTPPSVNIGSGEYLLVKPPSDLEKLYPPVFKRYEFARLMDSLAKYYYELKTDIDEGDNDYVEFSFRLFARQYQLVSTQMPGMQQFFQTDQLDVLAKQLKITSPGDTAGTEGYQAMPEEMAHEEETLTEEDQPPSEKKDEEMASGINTEAQKTLADLYENSCQACHYAYRPATFFAFYWGTRGMKYNMVSFRMKDPVTKKGDISMKDFMLLLGDSYYGVYSGMDKGQKRYVRIKLDQFNKRMGALDGSCMKCHWDEPDKYMLKTVKPQMKALKDEAKRYKPRKDVLSKNMGTIWKDVCTGCHMIHMPVYQIQEVWYGEIEAGSK